ncbi:ABC transporter permease [Brucella tritici]|uniref:ABC transporter permease n=1 Tax=Brucella tritici TaxID=94626 RepID=A0A833FLE4_9HYPH|nr:ABC transporter permease [Brucella tritici]KAB2663770.1 ABC transporter permease [Brucella tritici]
MNGVFKPSWLLLGLFSWLVLLFLIAPIIAIVPLSFNSEPYMSYPMAGFSLRWYEAVLTSSQWTAALKSSLIVGTATTVIATTLGTMAAFGLVRKGMPKAQMVMGILLMPLAIPVVTVALALYLVFSRIGLTNSYLGLIIAHTVLATPFVLVTVTSALANFDFALLRAGASLGAGPLTVFRRITLPIILPGVLTGALFAFITSWDEVVVALFIAGPEQRTLPRQMFAGLREQLDPSILVVASLLIAISICLALFGFLIRLRGKKLSRR